LSSQTVVEPADHPSRSTIRTIIVLFGIVFAGMWAAVAYSLVTSRQHALEHAMPRAAT
jgi:hypothetical protein